MSTFGFYTNGHLNVNLSRLVLSSETGNEKVLIVVIDKANAMSFNGVCLLFFSWVCLWIKPPLIK